MKLRLGVVLTLLAPALACKAPEKPKPPPNPPSITSFTVDKQNIRRGEMVTFNFTVDRATSVELIDQAGAPVAVTFDDLAGTGSAKASPQTSAFYVLRASGDGGRDSAFVQVAVDEGLQSVFLVVVPQRVKPGERVDLIWSAAGGRNVKLTAGMQELSTMETGSLSQTPVTTTTYTLQGERADGSLSSQSATVTVVPVIQEFSASPAAAKPGEKITVSWKTAGADQVVLEEASFGQLLTTTTNAATGTFEFQVPAYFADAGLVDAGTSTTMTDGGTDDGGVDAGVTLPAVPLVRDGFPLRFTLSARTTTPMQQVERALDARVGQGPSIDVFECPSFGSRGKPLTISWRTSGTARIELRANGLPVYSPLAGVNTIGTFNLGLFSAETTFTLVAFDFNGLEASVSKTVRVVPSPRINTFVAPMATTTAAMKVTVTWTTADANFVMLRLKGGPAFFREDAMNSVANGTAQFTVPIKGTYVFEAYNLAGDRATEERTIDVGAPIVFTITPELMARGDLATMAWDTSLVTSTDLPGLSAPPPARAMNPNGFDDISTAPNAQQLFFADKDDDVATITLPFGFVFPFVTQQATKLTVSTNGFVAIAPAADAAPTNADLSDIGYAGPPMLAPFWDDLDLGTQGKVLWNFDDATFPRRLTISWHDVERYGEPNTKLTFQVQLFETGKFIFAYKVLTGTGTDGVSATIGAVDAPDIYQGLVAFDSSTSAELAIDTERVWFSGNNETIGQRQMRLRRHSTLGFFIESGQERIPVYGRARAFQIGDVQITEAMPAPLPSIPAGRWLELFNPGDQELEVGGLRLESASGGMNNFVLPSAVMAARGHLVAGETLDAGDNGDAGVQVAWGMSLPLATPDTVRLVLPGALSSDGGPFVISRFSWGALIDAMLPDGGFARDAGVTAGVSVQAPEAVLVRSGAPPFSCPRMASFGPPTQFGTPGRANERCAPYSVTSIPSDFVNISAVPNARITMVPYDIFSADDEGIAVVEVATPFPYFGAAAITTFTISSNGFVLPYALTPSGAGHFSNKTLPNGDEPVGTIAPFWDDLRALPTSRPSSGVFGVTSADVTIIQWNDVETFAGSNNLTFQVKLFANGIIEYHYGPGTGTGRASGNSATAWVESIDGTHAVAASIDQGVLLPGTAFRFTPRTLGSTP